MALPLIDLPLLFLSFFLSFLSKKKYYCWVRRKRKTTAGSEEKERLLLGQEKEREREREREGARCEMMDVVVFGATGFTGALVVEYMLQQYGVGSSAEVKWAIAGRSKAKLEKVKCDLERRLGKESGAADIPVIVADSANKSSLDEMCSGTKVVLSTVGPFQKYGSLLVKSCIENGTNYCDSTGETSWIRRMIDQHHEQAVAKKVRLVPSCGYDSIPSDLGALTMVRGIQADGKEPGQITHYIGPFKGGASGGTLHTIINLISNEDKRLLLKVLSDPYGLSPDNANNGTDSGDQRWAHWVAQDHVYSAPFVMAGGNERLVRRSAAQLDFGKRFRYLEVIAFKSAFKSLVAALAMSLGFLLLVFPPFQWLIVKFLPEPGQGPSRELRDSGFAYSTLVSHSDNGECHYTVEVAITKGDAGYKSTAGMLAESAIAMAKSKDADGQYGFLTPASCPGLQETLANNLGRCGIFFTFSKHDTGVVARQKIKCFDSQM